MFFHQEAPSSLRTVTSHMSNCFDGVTKGFRYKMRAVYAHFPVNLNIGNKGEKIEIRNFLGEKRTRTCVMAEGSRSRGTTPSRMASSSRATTSTTSPSPPRSST